VRERPLDEETLSDLVVAADLVALPFTRASQSSSAIFALSHRRAVVTTAVGAVAELGSAGAVATVGVGDSRELAEVCLRLIAVPRARRDLAERGFRYAARELAPARIARKTSALYAAASGASA
jgi:glycosyltransferase involved in cell wall biosynthesis